MKLTNLGNYCGLFVKCQEIIASEVLLWLVVLCGFYLVGLFGFFLNVIGSANTASGANYKLH